MVVLPKFNMWEWSKLEVVTEGEAIVMFCWDLAKVGKMWVPPIAVKLMEVCVLHMLTLTMFMLGILGGRQCQPHEYMEVVRHVSINEAGLTEVE